MGEFEHLERFFRLTGGVGEGCFQVVGIGVIRIGRDHGVEEAGAEFIGGRGVGFEEGSGVGLDGFG